MEDTLREINMNFQMILNYVVLILILMEDTLREFWDGVEDKAEDVLILILMEDTLRVLQLWIQFNHYFLS